MKPVIVPCLVPTGHGIFGISWNFKRSFPDIESQGILYIFCLSHGISGIFVCRFKFLFLFIKMYFFYTVFFVKSRFALFAFCKAKCKVLKGKGNTTAACFSVHCRSWKFSFSVSECQGKIREFDIWLRVGTLIVSVFFVCLCS